ncbi:Rubrerythrin family protein [Histomonas meleagridis]|uniref:Rubrerythrin family protein n=1 Tax=Histomonas meleagridis TaxID=135588 RepID=UPI0035598CE5|nr:Rubrerythrin family protein [Histomonas meleagridis]KAH0807086.1 Rubrerythrin family protein [Histomonas meleagridis]
MTELKGSRTEKNLAISYAGESMARNRYTFFASIAKKQGYEHIAAIFIETAENEKEHAKRFLKFLKGTGAPIHVQCEIPGSFFGSTLENLKQAADGEKEEHMQGYPHMAAIAEQEGFHEIADLFRKIAAVEREHEKRFRILIQQFEEGTVFRRDREVEWKCRNCGYIFRGFEAPEECPACGHKQGFFEVREVLE